MLTEEPFFRAPALHVHCPPLRTRDLALLGPEPGTAPRLPALTPCPPPHGTVNLKTQGTANLKSRANPHGYTRSLRTHGYTRTSFGKCAAATSNAASFVSPFCPCSLMHPIMRAQYLTWESFGYARWIWAKWSRRR